MQILYKYSDNFSCLLDGCFFKIVDFVLNSTKIDNYVLYVDISFTNNYIDNDDFSQFWYNLTNLKPKQEEMNKYYSDTHEGTQFIKLWKQTNPSCINHNEIFDESIELLCHLYFRDRFRFRCSLLFLVCHQKLIFVVEFLYIY